MTRCSIGRSAWIARNEATNMKTKHIAAVICLLILAAVASSGGQQQPAPPRHQQIAELEKLIAERMNEPAEQVFKNIQTFKGMPAGRVLRIMEMAFVPNLGVECTHCHVEGQWELDDKPAKKIARGMWTLRANVQDQVRQITGKTDVPVTCYTCHKGQPKPSFAPQ
jgi:hypothetical protein